MKKSDAKKIAVEVVRILEPQIASLLVYNTFNKERAAKYLCMSVSNLESKLKEIPHSKPGKELVFHKRDLDSYLEQKRCWNRDDELKVVMRQMGIKG